MTHPPDSLPQPTDPAHLLRVKVGADFTIVLEANHTTGYSWQLMPLPTPPAVHEVGTDYQTQPHPPGMAGMGGWEVWTFHALRPQQTTLTFHYRRPFDPVAPPAEIVTFTVVVHA